MSPLSFDRDHFKEPALRYIRRDLPLLRPGQTVEEALAAIRSHGLGERVIYFYVTDEKGRLLGVVPTRRLLTAPLEAAVGSLMVGNVVSLRDDATMLEVFEAFHAHKLLALPLVAPDGSLEGVIDLGAISEDLFDTEARIQADAVFEAIGFELGRIRNLSSTQVTLIRLRWLLVTMASGLVCALLAAGFTATLTAGTSLAFFIALVLALGESTGMQTMTVTLQALHGIKPGRQWLLRSLAREVRVAVPLGLAAGLMAGSVVYLWLREPSTALILGSAVALSIGSACVVGLLVPAFLHAAGLDYRIAASPATLAITDVLTLSIYFLIASALIR